MAGLAQPRICWRRVTRSRRLCLGSLERPAGWAGAGLPAGRDQPTVAAGVLLSVVLRAGIAVSGVAALAPGREPVFENVAELRRAFGPPVLGSVAYPTAGLWRRASPTSPFVLAMPPAAHLARGSAWAGQAHCQHDAPAAVLSAVLRQTPSSPFCQNSRGGSRQAAQPPVEPGRPRRPGDTQMPQRRPFAPAHLPLVVRAPRSAGAPRSNSGRAGRLSNDRAGLLAAGVPDPRCPGGAPRGTAQRASALELERRDRSAIVAAERRAALRGALTDLQRLRP